MIIGWEIDYHKKTASCSQLKVSIIKVTDSEPLAQKIEDQTVSIGFKKIGGDSYFCLITNISKELWTWNKQDNDMLNSYMSQLGDLFNEYHYINPPKTRARARVQKECKLCGELFSGAVQAKFCSNACRQKNKRAK